MGEHKLSYMFTTYLLTHSPLQPNRVVESRRQRGEPSGSSFTTTR